MYPLHEMDYNYIVKSIRSNKYLTKEFKEMLVHDLYNESALFLSQKDYIILSLKYNNDLSSSYKEMLIFKIKEGVKI